MEHFTAHIWLKIHEVNVEEIGDLNNYFLKTLPIEKWLKEQGLSQDHPDAKVFIIEMKKRISDLIVGTICLKENIVFDYTLNIES